MGRLSASQRMQVIAINNDLNDLGIRNICKKVSEIAQQQAISISAEGVRLIILKWTSSKHCKFSF